MLFAIFATLILSYLGGATIGIWMNWPDFSSVVAVMVMGSFILYELRKPKEK